MLDMPTPYCGSGSDSRVFAQDAHLTWERRRPILKAMQRVHIYPGKALCRFCGRQVATNSLSVHIAKEHPRAKDASMSPRLVSKHPAAKKRKPK
jgi:hypothetical protein